MSALGSPKTYAGLAAFHAVDAVACGVQVAPIKKILDDLGVPEEIRPVFPIVKGAAHPGDPRSQGDFGGAGMNERELCTLERAGIGEGPWAAYLDFSAMLILRMLLFGYFDDVRLIQGRFDAAGEYAGGPHTDAATLTDSLGHPLAAPHYSVAA